jgi:hypothetical protein
MCQLIVCHPLRGVLRSELEIRFPIVNPDPVCQIINISDCH